MTTLARFILTVGWMLLCSIGLAAATVIPVQGDLRATDLRCEYAENPFGIDVAQPRLSWKLVSSQRGQRQTAYQIRAQTFPALTEIWDSGKVFSDETHLIRYTGKKLESSQTIAWNVRIWDEQGRLWETNHYDTWRMGLLQPEDWNARWICAPTATDSLLLRKEFVVKPGLRSAIAHVTGLGQYEMSINGNKIGRDLLSPGWTDFNDTILYDTRYILYFLREGKNTVGLTLGNGMYHVERRHRFAKFTGSFGPQRAICQIELEYADGTKEFVGTDETWRVHPGGITYNSIFGGEDFDARLHPTGWNKPGYNDKTWQNAVAVVRPAGTLRGHSASSEPIQAIEERQPSDIRWLSDRIVVSDFGQNASYMPRLRISGPAGSTVRLIPAEAINADGSIQRSTMGSTNRGISWWQYTKSTDKVEEWFPQFYYVGCRYLQAELSPAKPGGKLPAIKSLQGVIVHSSAAPVGEFECSNPLLNRIRDLVRWAQRANMVSVLTDCPHREKLGWLEQYHLNGPAIRYEFDMARMFTKGMNDMADAQTDSGLIPNIAPEYTEFKGAFRSSPEWGSAFLIVPWQQYQFNGDLDLFRTHYADMKRYFAYLENSASNHIVHLSLGDWFDLGPKKSGASQNTPPPVTATAFYYHDAWILSQAAALLGKTNEAREFAAKAETIRRAFNEKFFDASHGTYATGSQAANSLALVFGLVPPAHSNAVLASLVKDVEARDAQMTAGDIGFRFLLQALAQGGRSDLVYRMINQDEKPGYGYMLKKGETSLTEAWDANLTTSHNHFMLGHITEWFYKDLVGIDCDPRGPGFKKIIIRPNPVGDLKWAKASYDSDRGKISTEWRRDAGKFTLNVTIPANTTATVFLPAKSADAISESGKTLAQTDGVTFLRQENDRIVLAIESGAFRFKVRP